MARPLGLGLRRLRIGSAAAAPPSPPSPPPTQALLVTELGHILITETGAAIAVEQP